jgi:peptidoglycan-associated lipoprotein
MKPFSKLGALALVAVLSLAAGCKKGQKNLTPLPGYSGPATSGTITTGQPYTPPSQPYVPPQNTVGKPYVQDQPPGGTDIITKNSETKAVGQGDRVLWENMVMDTEQFRGNTVYFEYDKSAIKGDQKPNVVLVSEYLKSHSETKLLVDGHCDERGTEEYNRALGERRALSVREMLLNLGISADRVFTRSFGEDKPVDLGHDEAAWNKNRRGEFILLLPQGGIK